MEFRHTPVMLDEVIDGLKIKKDGIYVDCTLGGAGHSLEIVKRLDEGKLIGIDQDIDAINVAREVLKEYENKVYIVNDNFKNSKKILEDLDVEKVDGILLDLGVSSYQLDKGERGFSYNQDAILDMRMDKDSDITAWNVINEYSQKDLEKIIWEYGEERWAKRISEFIIAEREHKPIDTTLDLVSIIKKAIPKGARSTGHHPAKKTFQAIRIEVNDELNILKEAINNLCSVLKPKGRICIIAFHSLEDRIVKNTFKELNQDCICPPNIPICICDKEKELDIITKKPIIPTKEELNLNPRSRSAKLRIGEKV